MNSTELVAQKFNINKGNFKSPAYRVWSEIIKEIASQMVVNNDDRISEIELIRIIQRAYPSINTELFLQTLETNTLVVKVPRYKDNQQASGFDIRFPFQKFSDHLIGRYIFKKYEQEFGKQNKNIKTAKKYFSKRRKLGQFLAKSWNRGIIEALSIQCPEQLRGVEFIEVAPYLQNEPYLTQIAEESFIESIIWRNPKAFSQEVNNTLKIINKSIIKTEYGHNRLLNAFLSVSPIPNHPFNARRFHDHLFKFSLPDRDSWWSTFLHYQFGEQGAVDRLLEWSWSNMDMKHLSDESIFLTSITLTWFLTTSNRFVRDRATKGLVCLLQNRIELLPSLLEKFKKVNDPYISERLYAIAYGCILRNQENNKHLKTLAEWIYQNIFKDNQPPTHILLRDYARGIIETATTRGIKLKINPVNINPPYKSKWPKRIPSEKSLKKRYYPENFLKKKTTDQGYLDIWLSVMDFGDFARYVIGTNSWSNGWSGRNLKSSDPDRKEIFKIFKKKLSKKQSELLEKSINQVFGINFSEICEYLKLTYSKHIEECSNLDLENLQKKTKSEQKRSFLVFEKSLTEEQKKFFKKEIKPFINDRGNIDDPLETFNLKIAQRWIFNRVVKLGYSPKIHGEFDRQINSHISDRREHKAERIGKKYQWIAYHEFMALLVDHFEFKGNSWDSTKKIYKGPWSPHIRDIDPSFILQNDTQIKDIVNFSDWKLKYAKYDTWEKKKSNINWIKTCTDLPKPKDNIQIMDNNKDKWLILQGFLDWKEKTPPEHKEYDIPRREIWYMLRSYIVNKKDVNKFFDWAVKQNFQGRWMPESNNVNEIFLGEYPNSVAFEDLRGNHNTWTTSVRKNGALQIPILGTDDTYLNEFTLDCSHSGSVSIKLPCKWLVNRMSLSQKSLDGRFFDKRGKLTTINTSIFEEGSPSILLINKKALTDFLNQSDYSIVWTLLGEKQLIGGPLSNKNYIGRLEISGVYTFNSKGNIIGNSNKCFVK